MMNKFQSTAFRSALLIAGVAVVAMPIVASAKNSTNKVTGNAMTSSATATGEFSMNVTDGISASVSQSDLQQHAFSYNSASATYTVDVRFANFVENAVWLTGPIMTSNDSTQIGKWLVATVRDNGQNGNTPDSVSVRLVSAPSIAYNMVANQNQFLFEQHDVTNGNLVIR